MLDFASGRLSANAGGFLHPTYRNAAISYAVGLDANAPNYHPDLFSQPMLLASDRNFLTNGPNAQCSSGVMTAATVRRHVLISEWIDALHGRMGNALLTDGQVQTINTPELRTLLVNAKDDNGDQHFLFP